MSDCFVGEVRLFAGNYAPVGWALCNGQMLNVSNNQALFTLIGTTYGGDGRMTFGVPDMRGRVVVGAGQGGGLTNRIPSQAFGSQSTTILPANMPSHSHAFYANAVTSTDFGPGNEQRTFGSFATAGSVKGLYSSGGSKANVTLNPAAISTAYGGAQAHSNMMGTATLNYIICLVGLFPSQG